MKIAVALMALLPLAGLGEESALPDKGGPCESLTFESTTLAEVVALYGPPCSVSMSWDAFGSLGSAELRNVDLNYGVCAVPCGSSETKDFPFNGGLCHTMSFEALAGPLGLATKAKFAIREGVLSHVYWEYYDEKAVSARTAITKIPGLDASTAGISPISEYWFSSNCDVSATERPERVLGVFASKPESLIGSHKDPSESPSQPEKLTTRR